MTEISARKQIEIDGRQYELDKLSDNAKLQIENIKFVDSMLQQLNNEWAIADTAKMAYTKALKSECEKLN